MGEASGVFGRVVGRGAPDADEAWDAFLAEQAPLILQVVHLFERDADQVQDCFVFVCEQLRRDGRFRLPRAIARLPELEREVFRCLHLRGLSANEAFHSLGALWPALTRDQLSAAAERVSRAVDQRSSWLLLWRRPRMQSISDAAPGADPAEAEAGLVDPRADPERDAAERERTAALDEALAGLPARARLLVRLRYEQELPVEEVARLTGLSGASQAERQLRQALEELRAAMAAKGFPGVSVKDGQRP